MSLTQAALKHLPEGGMSNYSGIRSRPYPAQFQLSHGDGFRGLPNSGVEKSVPSGDQVISIVRKIIGVVNDIKAFCFPDTIVPNA
jgi:hypothetical protein